MPPDLCHLLPIFTQEHQKYGQCHPTSWHTNKDENDVSSSRNIPHYIWCGCNFVVDVTLQHQATSLARWQMTVLHQLQWGEDCAISLQPLRLVHPQKGGTQSPSASRGTHLCWLDCNSNVISFIMIVCKRDSYSRGITNTCNNNHQTSLGRTPT